MKKTSLILLFTLIASPAISANWNWSAPKMNNLPEEAVVSKDTQDASISTKEIQPTNKGNLLSLISQDDILKSSADLNMSEEFKIIDTNSDNYLDEDELYAYQQLSINDENNQTFNSIDLNKDGSITLEEYLDLYTKHDPSKNNIKTMTNRFNTIDIDDSNDLSLSEIKHFRQKNINQDNLELFNSLDENGDKRISQKEFLDFFSFIIELFSFQNN